MKKLKQELKNGALTFFEAVKEVYGYGIPFDFPFLQLYILGDDFALEDEYYRGGVTW